MVVSRSMASAKRRKRVKVLELQSLEGWRGGEKEVGSRERVRKIVMLNFLKMSQLRGTSGLV